jgi:hypothetical protein
LNFSLLKIWNAVVSSALRFWLTLASGDTAARCCPVGALSAHLYPRRRCLEFAPSPSTGSTASERSRTLLTAAEVEQHQHPLTPAPSQAATWAKYFNE